MVKPIILTNCGSLNCGSLKHTWGEFVLLHDYMTIRRGTFNRTCRLLRIIRQLIRMLSYVLQAQNLNARDDTITPTIRRQAPFSGSNDNHPSLMVNIQQRQQPGGRFPRPSRAETSPLEKRNACVWRNLVYPRDASPWKPPRPERATRGGAVDPCVPTLSCLHADGTHPGNGSHGCADSDDFDGVNVLLRQSTPRLQVGGPGDLYFTRQSCSTDYTWTVLTLFGILCTRCRFCVCSNQQYQTKHFWYK